MKTRGRIVLACVASGVGIVAFLFVTRGYGWLWHGPFTPSLIRYSDEAYAETRVRATQLVASLDAYIQDCKEYPVRLEDLVPRHHTGIQPPTVGFGRWEYARVSPDRFRLRFHVGQLYEADWYDSAKGEWHVDR